MAQERSVIDLSKKNTPIDEDKRKEFAAKAAKVLSRVVVTDRLNVELPPDVYGEWIRDDAVSLAEAATLGFEIDKTYAPSKALHRDAEGKAKVGDAVFMTMPKWQKEEIDKIKKEQYARQHGLRNSKLAEETQFLSGLPQGIVPIDESKTSNVNLTTIVNSE